MTIDNQPGPLDNKSKFLVFSENELRSEIYSEIYKYQKTIIFQVLIGSVIWLASMFLLGHLVNKFFANDDNDADSSSLTTHPDVECVNFYQDVNGAEGPLSIQFEYKASNDIGVLHHNIYKKTRLVDGSQGVVRAYGDASNCQAHLQGFLNQNTTEFPGKVTGSIIGRCFVESQNTLEVGQNLPLEKAKPVLVGSFLCGPSR